MHNEHSRSVSLILIAFKPIPLLSLVFFFNIEFTCSVLCYLFSLSSNKAFHALHVITNGILSLFPLNYLFGGVGHCKTSWMGEMCLSLCLFSDLLCMAVLVLEFSSRVLRVISATSRLDVCLFLFVLDLYFLILHYYTVPT